MQGPWSSASSLPLPLGSLHTSESCSFLNVQWCSLCSKPLHKLIGPQFLENVLPFPYQNLCKELFSLLPQLNSLLTFSSDFYVYTHSPLSLECAMHASCSTYHRMLLKINSTLLAAGKHDFIQHTANIYWVSIKPPWDRWNKHGPPSWKLYLLFTLYPKCLHYHANKYLSLWFLFVFRVWSQLTYCHHLSLQELLIFTDGVGKMHLKPNSACLRHIINSKF